MPAAASLASVGDVLELVRAGQAATRSDIGRVTGLSRTAVTARVNALLGSGLLVETSDGPSTGGRPPSLLGFAPSAGLVLAIAVGRSRTQLAACDLAGDLQASMDLEQAVGATPDEVMPAVVDELRGLVRGLGRSASDVLGVGISIPGTVDADRGVSLSSPIMKGWDGVPLAPFLARLTEAPVYVDNDANVLALSERSGHLETFDHAVLVKASTGLGAGIVADGRLLRGALGASGEIGHTKTPAAKGRACRCGDVGCLEAVAGGWTLVQAWRDRGGQGSRQVTHVRDLVDKALDGEAAARRMIRESGRRTGEVLGGVVNVLNPEVVVIGGDMARAYDVFVAGVRETLYGNATALATRELEIVESTHGEQAGVVGCAALALEHVLSPQAVDRALAG